ncbi:protein of unknown function [Georgfuchsia toluolica]|uniref:Uncharacterized protein n=1 Tax=Georgfuchsia toluolica TaxID=424218 RepID=A0A916N0L7_9PROT|nr:hypothetical protein [Georgfuchsia toluolica]CAG4884063.1 protein of unknown function [Georgfuchsia toluolica]
MKHPLTKENVAIERSKKIAASLRQMRKKSSGMDMSPPSAGKPRKPGESTASRNNRIIERFKQLQAQKEINPRKIRGQLAREFDLSRQYIERVLKPYLLSVAARIRR